MALPASYAFTTTENPLSATYWAAFGGDSNIQAANGYARSTVTGYARASMYWSADSPGANQYAQADAITTSNSVIGVFVRGISASSNYYEYNFDGTGRLRRYDNDVVTELGTALANGTRPLTIKITAGEGSSSTIKGYEAGAVKVAVTDATYSAAGVFGLALYQGTLEDAADNFLADNITWAGHTLDTNLRFSGTSNPQVQAYTCGATATELVLAIVTAGTTSRSGGDPTYNGVAMIQRDSTRKYATNPETSCEIWQLDAPATGANNISIPNTGGLTIYAQASSYIAPAGYTSAYDTATGNTGASANPSVSITPSVDNCVIIAVLGDGLDTAPTGQSGINLNRTDDGAYSDSNMYNLQGTAAPFAARWTVASDDWCMCVLSIKPVAAAIAGFPFLIFKPQNTLLRM